MRRPDTIRAIPDPVARARAAAEAVTETQRLVGEYADITAQAVVEMRQTMSLGQIAAALGVSRTRVQQLEARGRAVT